VSKKLNLPSALGIFLIGLFSANVSQAQYTNVYWDANGVTAGTGGTGTWNSSNALWATNSDGSGTLSSPTTLGTNIIYNFSGTNGTVSETSSFTVAGINWLTSGYTWSSTANRTLTGVDTNSTGANTIFIASAANLNITGTGFSFNGLSMTGGAGSTLTLTNAAAATTTINFGTSTATGGRTNSVNTIIAGAGTVVIGNGAPSGFTQAGNITNSTTGMLVLTNSASGDLNVLGAVSGNGALTLGVSYSGNIVMSNAISGNSALTLSLTGATNGKINLMAANSYTGGTTIQQTNGGSVGVGASASFGSGTLTIAGAGTNWVVAQNNNLNIANATVISNGSTYRLSSLNTGWQQTNSGLITGGGSIFFSQADSQTLSNTNNTFGGGVNIGSSTKVYVNSIGTSGANSSLGTNGTITFSSRTGTSSAAELYWMGNTNETSDKAFALTTVSTASGMKIYAGDNGTGGTNVTLTLNGNINSTGATNQTITLGAYNGNTLAMNGTINQTAGYTNSLVVGNSGTGTVVLGNTNNSFGGGLTINAGSASTNTVQVAKIGNAGTNSVLGTNGTINIGGSSATGVNILKYVGTGETNDKVINLAGANGGATLDQSGTGNLKFSSATTATGVGAKTITLQGSTAGTGELAGAISDQGANAVSLAKTGSGTWTLSGVNTYTGLTQIGAGGAPGGTLKIGLTNGLLKGVLVGASSLANTGTLDLTAGGDYVMNSYGNSVNAGNSMAFTNSSGTATTLTFTNANNYITMSSNGGKTLTNATANLTVAFNGAVDIGSSTAGDVLFTGPGAFTLNGALNSTGSALRGLTKSGDGTLTLNAASGYNGVTTLSLGTIALGANGTLGTNSVVMNGGTLAVGTSSSTIKDLTVTNGTITGSGTLNSANSFTFANTATSTVSANLAGAAAVTQTGSSRVVLSGSNSFSGGLNLNSAGSGVDVTRAEALGTGTITAGSTNSKLGLNTITSLTITNAVNTGSSNTATMAFTPGASGNSMTVSGLISGSGIAKVSGGGDLYLNNSGNTYSGGTEVGTGRIYVGSDGALGATTGAVNFGTTTNSLLAITSDVSFNASRNFTMSAAGYTANIDTGANNVTINGVIAPISGVTGGLLAKLGTGSLTLAGANTYSGTTTISSGVLNIRNSAGLGATNAGTTVADLAALELQNGISVGQEELTLNGTGVSSRGALRNISGNNTYGGLLTLGSASRINSDSGTLSLTNAGTITGNTFGLTVGGAGDTVLNSILGTTSGTLTKDGAGKLTLGGANTFTGLTTVSGGTLAYGVANALSSGAVTVNGSGAVLDIATFSDTVGAVTLTTGSITGTTGVLTGTSFAMDGTGSASAILDGSGATLTKTGAGTTTTLSRTNTYTGATTVSQGTLLVDTTGSIASSSATVNGGLLNVNGTAGSVTVNDGGSLGGSGSVGELSLNRGGLLNPGNSPGTLTAAQAIVMGGSTYNWQISNSGVGTTAGTDWDLFSVGGLLNMSNVTDANKWNLVVTADGAFTGWTDSNSPYEYVFAQAAGISLSSGFSTAVGTDVTSLFNITSSGITSLPNSSYNANGDFKVLVGRGSNDVITLNLQAIPEPSTGSMLTLGIAGLVATRLLRRKSS